MQFLSAFTTEPRKLFDVLRNSTVKIILPNNSMGTGFFVAQSHILTCNHVLKGCNNLESIKILYKKNEYKIIQIINPNLSEPYPDLTLLKINIVDLHDCVKTSEKATEINTELWTFGYPVKHPFGESLLLKYEGPTFLDDNFYNSYEFEDDNPQKYLLKIKDGHVEEGFSGSPILNLTTGEVCGVLQSTRDKFSNLGGRAIPIKEARKYWKDILSLKESKVIEWKKNVEEVDLQRKLVVKVFENSKTDLPTLYSDEHTYLKLTINGEFDLFKSQELNRILSELAKTLNINESNIVFYKKEQGSIILNISLPTKNLSKLSNLILTGDLLKLKIMYIQPFNNEKKPDFLDRFFNTISSHYRIYEDKLTTLFGSLVVISLIGFIVFAFTSNDKNYIFYAIIIILIFFAIGGFIKGSNTFKG